ncbi:MAG: NADH-quinone oxidoreductase subunit C [Candidatus Bipolaricaulis sp.]|nr:NADH-quinone oxidoreductase subunit C [Candidatus Bipolaricaulis sp.]MDD5646682.1 NADH-quinone oxidoreductase subunit C [Candidatus Bipolaricaulis sp.]
MKPQELLSTFRATLGSRLLEGRIVERRVGTVTPSVVSDIWLVVAREALHDAVAHLCARYTPHLSVISGDDLDETVAFNYHFTTGWGERFGEATCTIRTVIPKSDLRLPTITDLVPGAQTSEREKREFYGVEIEGIPDARNLFLPQGSTIHPWRKDLEAETATLVKRMVRWEARDE